MKLAAAALVVLGLLQIVGNVLGVAPLAGIGAATGASPAPKVFSAVRGLETYSTRFYLEWADISGRIESVLLTPEINARLVGPYNRRNVYGAVLAYGPVLVAEPRTRPMFDSVARHALCGDAPLLRELGLASEGMAGNVRVRLEPRPGSDTGELLLVLEPPCP